MKEWVKRAVSTCFEEHELYRIYQSPPLDADSCARPDETIVELTKDSFESAPPFIRSLQHYLGTESIAAGIYVGDNLASAAVFLWGDTYYRTDGFIPIGRGQAKLEQINTDERYRGRGLATKVIAGSCHIMRAKGFRRLYARVWHNNKGSVRAFEKAGWTEIGFVAGVRTRSRSWRISYPLSLLRSLPG
jgi:ribosomal protein S18 acetylase RimI-like enzyme